MTATGAISVKVAALTEGVVKAMFVSRIKAALSVVLLLGLLGTGGTLLTYRTASGQDEKKPVAEKLVETPVKPQKEPDVAWGPEADGLQAGLVHVETRFVRRGEAVRMELKLEVKIRNVGKTPVTITYGMPRETEPKITDAAGKKVWVTMPPVDDFIVIPTERVIEPGKTFTLFHPEVFVEADTGQPLPEFVETPTIRSRRNTFTISYIGTVDSHPKITTGTITFKYVGDEVAWGKAVDGLQAGLSFRAGEHPAYHHGETVTLVVRVRNVGHEEVKFSYLQPLIEHSLNVTDSDGKLVPQPEVIPDIGERDAGVVELPPGKEIELHELKRQLRPASESGSRKFMRPYALYGTGKVSVQYEQVFGLPSMGAPGWKLDPALSKLATGKLELEVKEAEK
jgi:hypothetical protein